MCIISREGNSVSEGSKHDRMPFSALYFLKQLPQRRAPTIANSSMYAPSAKQRKDVLFIVDIMGSLYRSDVVLFIVVSTGSTSTEKYAINACIDDSYNYH